MIKNILKWSTISGLYLIPFVAFIVPSAMFFPFISGKGFAFRILIEILLGLYTALAVLAPEYRPKMSWITKSVGIFTLIVLLADIFGVNPYKSLWSNYERMEGFVLIVHLAAFYIVASSVFNLKRWNNFWNISIGASVIMSIYGILQLIGKVTINQGGVRLDATFGNSAYLAIYLVFHIFLSLYMIIQSVNKGSGSDTYASGKPGAHVWQRYVYGAVAILETVILYFTATRGAILGLIGGLLIAAIIMVWKEKGTSKEAVWLKKSAYVFLIGIALVVITFFALRNASFVQKSPVLSRFASISKSEITSQGRYYVWPMAVKGALERPILGWGQENFNYVFNKNYDPRMYAQEQWFDRTHNIVLDWLIAGGILGLLAYVSLYVSLMYYMWRKKSLMSVAEKSILTGLLVAYVFHNMFVFDNLISYIIFFSLLAYVHTVNTVREDVYTVKTTKFYTKTFSSDTTHYLVFPVVAVVTIFLVYIVNVPALRANSVLIQAISPQTNVGPEKNLELFKQVFAYNSFGSSEALEQLIQISSQISTVAEVPDALKKQFYDYSTQKIEEKIKQTPNDARYEVFAGSFFNRFGQYDIAIPYLTKAVDLSPKKQTIYFELGTAYIGKKDYQKAFETFQTAYNLDQSYPDAKIIYAVGALYTKNTPLVTKLYTELGQNTIISDNRFLRAYADIGDYQSVIQILTVRIQKEPTNLNYQLSLASAYVQIGQKQQAIVILNTMIKEDLTFKTQGESYIKQIQGN